MNQYEVAIRSVLEICEHYNHQKLFDAVGFGAKACIIELIDSRV